MRLHCLRVAAATLSGLAVLAVAVQPARAGYTFNYNPAGTGNVGTVYATGGFVPKPGNVLAQGALPALAHAVTSGGGDVAGNQFQLYYQASTSSLLDANGNALIPTGLNSNYQITYVASVTEYVKTVTPDGSTATFGISANQTNDFFKVYQGAAGAANDYTGQGFTNGTLILSGTVVPNQTTGGNFTDTGGSAPFDPANPAHYPGFTTVNGNGGSVINFQVNFNNPNYILNSPPLVAMQFSGSNNLPFGTNIEPSLVFAGLAPGGSDITPQLGSMNGLPIALGNTNGKDVQFMATGTVQPIPEPSSIVLTALGMTGAVVFARKKRAELS